MKKILFALIPCFWIATIILIIYWIPTPHRISGWWWFSTLMISIFLTNYERLNYEEEESNEF